jgi:predicted ribosome quality control (RQC) complex YloA/Tae2 family protein
VVFDSLSVNQMAGEIRRQLFGSRLTRVFAAAEDTAGLEFSRRPPQGQLLLCWNPQHARLHLTDGLAPAPGVSAAFVDVLRRYLRGARLVEIAQVGFDRVLRLDFQNAEGLGPEATCTLIFEPIGRWANAILCDPEGVIYDAANRVPAAVNRYRQLLSGERYYPPPGQNQPRLDTASPEDFLALAATRPDAALKKLLQEGFQGASPVLLQELWARTGLDPDALAEAQEAGWAEGLVSAMRAMLVEAAAPGAWLYRPREGPPFAYPIRLASHEEDAVEALPTLSEALNQVAREVTLGERLRQQRERLRGAVRHAAQQVARRREAREQAAEKARQAERWRDYGQALLSNLWRLPWGAAEVELPLYDAEGERLVRISVNPSYSPQDNARLYFDRYKKAQRAAKLLPTLLAADRRQQDYLEEMADEIERGDEAELGELEEELRRQGYLRKRRVRARPVAPALPFHRTAGRDGWPIWYGKTGLQNNRLLHEAGPEDVWLHVRDGSGGHVLIRTGGRTEEVPEAVLHLAARIAAGLSRLRGSGRVEVAYTRARHVRKPRGTPPGFVLFDDSSTVAVAPLYPPPE